MIKLIAPIAFSVILGACATADYSDNTFNRDPAASTAERACLARANSFTNGAEPFVVSSEFSQANSLVIIEDRNGDRYRCLSANNGQIAEFSVM